MTGSNSENQSLVFSDRRASENSRFRKLDSDTRGRFIGLLGLAAFSIWIAASLTSSFYFSVASEHWPTVTARVVSSGIYANGKGVGVSWAPKVEYQYQVAGTAHHASKIRYLMRTFYDQGSATDVEAPYPVGRLVSVFYDPQDPDRSVLEPGVPRGMWTQALIALFFFALCGYIFFEITHPERRFLLRSNPVETDYEEGQDEDQSQFA